MENNVFNELPLLLAVPRAASILGISRAAAYRLVATSELPVRRLGVASTSSPRGSENL
jgi:predicted DNA-binding transcriptional regulator AlpA